MYIFGMSKVTKQYLRRSGNRINIIKSVANEIARQDAYLADREGLVGQPVIFEKSKFSLEEELSQRLKSFSTNKFAKLRSLNIHNTSIKKGFFLELSTMYLVKVCELLVDEDDEVYAFGMSFGAEDDEKTGIMLADPWEPCHDVLVRIRPFYARVFNEKQEFFDTDILEKPLIPYCSGGTEELIPVFF